MKTKILFISLLFLYYMINMFGRFYGLFFNYVLTGILNFVLVYYMLRVNPFHKKGWLLILSPLFIFLGVIFYAFYYKINMPGLSGIMIYIISTLSGIILFYNSNKRKIIITYLIVYIFLVFNYFNIFNLFEMIMVEKNQNIGQQMPNIYLVDDSGNRVDLKYNNKVLVIDFWNVYCSKCISDFPEFEKVALDYNYRRDIDFMSINIFSDSIEIVKSKKYVNKFRFKNYHTDKSIFNILNFDAVPNYLIIGKDGRIKYFGDLNVEFYKSVNNIYRLIDNEI